jgi:hypothetical protein
MYEVCTGTELHGIGMTRVYEALTTSNVAHIKGYITQAEEQVISGPKRFIAECSAEHSLSSAWYMVKQNLDRLKSDCEQAPAFLECA